MRDKSCLREVGFHGFFHRPIDFLDLIVGRNGVHSSEHLRQIHHMTGIEEGNFFLPPLFAVFAAQIFRSVLSERVQKNFFFHVHQLLHAFVSHVHKRARLFHAHYLFDKRGSFRLVVQTHYGRLEFLQNFPARLKRRRHVLEQEAAETPCFRLLVYADLRLGYHAQSALASDKNLVEIGTGGVLGCAAGVDNIAVWEHYLHLQYHIVDFAVLGRNDAYSSVRQKSAHGRAGQRRRIVHRRVSFFVCRPLYMLIDCACAAFYVHTVGVDLVYLVHSLGVEKNAAANGNSAALRSAASAPSGYGNLVIVGDL